jgi:anti-anti-sigma factor
MQLSYEKNGDIQIVAIKGRIDGSNAKELENALRAGLGQPSQKAVLDFQDVGYISSAGLRVVLALAKQLEDASGELVLCALRPEVFEVFKICGFDDILSLAGHREAALKTLGVA